MTERIEARATDLIHIADDDQGKAPELIADMQAGIEQHVIACAEDLLQAIAARSGAAPLEADHGRL